MLLAFLFGSDVQMSFYLFSVLKKKKNTDKHGVPTPSFAGLLAELAIQHIRVRGVLCAISTSCWTVYAGFLFVACRLHWILAFDITNPRNDFCGEKNMNYLRDPLI